MSVATRGQRRHVVSLENPEGVAVPDGDGGYVQPYVEFAQRAAEIKPATAQDLERTTSGSVLSMQSLLMTMDFHPLVTTETRGRWTDPAGRAHVASFTGVTNPDQRCIELVIVAIEVVQ